MTAVKKRAQVSTRADTKVESRNAVVPRQLVLALGLVTGLAWLLIYLVTLSPTVNFIDSGELITALHEPGITHPPGYPLYTLLGYVASHFLWGEVAWRVNVLSAFAGAAAICGLYFLIIRVSLYSASRRVARTNPTAHKGRTRGPAQMAAQPAQMAAITWPTLGTAVAGASLLGVSATFWSRSVQAKMYTLHYFFVVAIFLCAVNARWAFERSETRSARRWLVSTALLLGLSFTNHLITSLLVPGLVLLLLWGHDWLERLRFIARHWAFVLPAFAAPLLLYLYLPWRSSQGPTMNWGSPDTFGDFWRHVTGWQYSSYLGEDLGVTLGRFWGFLGDQWSWLGWIIVPLCLVAGALLARDNLPVFTGTALTGLATVVFSLKYGSSEMVPYIVPLYIVLVLWLATAPQALARQLSPAGEQNGRATGQRPVAPAAVAGVALLTIYSGALQFPQQNHSNDHLAELFVANVLNNMEPGSIVLTDHWDLQSPAYYEQLVKGVRPDVVIVDKLLLKYPWYMGQLEKRYPWLIANSQDIAGPYRTEQRKWVNGQAFDGARIQQLYVNLLSSFVERNVERHPVYMLFSQPCDPNTPPQYCENNQIAPGYTRQPWGAALRLWPKSRTDIPLPPVPTFDLRGITYDKTPMDDFARLDAQMYLTAYRSAADIYTQANKPDVAKQLNDKADALEKALHAP